MTNLITSTLMVLFWLSLLLSGSAIAQPTGNGAPFSRYEITFRDFTVKHTWAEDVITGHSCLTYLSCTQNNLYKKDGLLDAKYKMVLSTTNAPKFKSCLRSGDYTYRKTGDTDFNHTYKAGQTVPSNCYTINNNTWIPTSNHCHGLATEDYGTKSMHRKNCHKHGQNCPTITLPSGWTFTVTGNDSIQVQFYALKDKNSSLQLPITKLTLDGQQQMGGNSFYIVFLAKLQLAKLGWDKTANLEITLDDPRYNKGSNGYVTNRHTVILHASIKRLAPELPEKLAAYVEDFLKGFTDTTLKSSLKQHAEKWANLKNDSISFNQFDEHSWKIFSYYSSHTAQPIALKNAKIPTRLFKFLKQNNPHGYFKIFKNSSYIPIPIAVLPDEFQSVKFNTFNSRKYWTVKIKAQFLKKRRLDEQNWKTLPKDLLIHLKTTEPSATITFKGTGVDKTIPITELPNEFTDWALQEFPEEIVPYMSFLSNQINHSQQHDFENAKQAWLDKGRQLDTSFYQFEGPYQVTLRSSVLLKQDWTFDGAKIPKIIFDFIKQRDADALLILKDKDSSSKFGVRITAIPEPQQYHRRDRKLKFDDIGVNALPWPRGVSVTSQKLYTTQSPVPNCQNGCSLPKNVPQIWFDQINKADNNALLVLTVSQSGKRKTVILPFNRFDSVRQQADLLKAHQLTLRLPETLRELRLSGSISLRVGLYQREKQIVVKNLNIQAADLTRNKLELPFFGPYQLGTGLSLRKEGQQTARGDLVLFKNKLRLSNHQLSFEDAKIPQSKVKFELPADYPQHHCQIQTQRGELTISQWLKRSKKGSTLSCPYVHDFKISILYDGTINLKPSLIRTAFKFSYASGRSINDWRLISAQQTVKLAKRTDFFLYALPSSFRLYPPKTEELFYEPISVDLKARCPQFYGMSSQQNCYTEQDGLKIDPVGSKITFIFTELQDKNLSTYTDTNSPWASMTFNWLIKKGNRSDLYQNCRLKPEAQHFTFQCENRPENASAMSQLTMRQLKHGQAELPKLGRSIAILNDDDLRKLYCGDWENLLFPKLNGMLIAPRRVSKVLVGGQTLSLFKLNDTYNYIPLPFGASVEQCDGCFIETLPNHSVRQDQVLCQQNALTPVNDSRENNAIPDARPVSIGNLESKLAWIFVFGKTLNESSGTNWLGKWRDDDKKIREQLLRANSSLEITVFFLYQKNKQLFFKNQLKVSKNSLSENNVYNKLIEPIDQRQKKLVNSSDSFESIDNQISVVLNKLVEKWGNAGNYQVLILADKFLSAELDGINHLSFCHGKGERKVVLVDYNKATPEEINQKLGSTPNVSFIDLSEEEWYKLAFEQLRK